MILDDTEDIDRLYLYKDDDHASLYSDSTIGSFYSQFVMILEKRGFRSVEYIDADGLSAILSDTGSAGGKAVFCGAPAAFRGSAEPQVREFVEALRGREA